MTDGLVITSGICPYMALKAKTNDGTEQLAIALVAAMKDRKQEAAPGLAPPQSAVGGMCQSLYDATFKAEFGFTSLNLCKIEHKCCR